MNGGATAAYPVTAEPDMNRPRHLRCRGRSDPSSVSER